MAKSNMTNEKRRIMAIDNCIELATSNKLTHEAKGILMNDIDSNRKGSKNENARTIHVLVGKETIRVKRETLKKNSLYFENMITKDLPTIDLTNLSNDHEAIITLLKWMKGKGLNFTMGNVASVLDVALKLNILAVVRMGIDFLMGELHLQNESLNRFSFKEIVNGPYFKHFSIDQMCRLLSDDQLEIQKEKEVFNAAVEWLRHDWNRRQQYTTKLIGCVRFGLMSESDILEISNNPQTVEIMKILDCQSYALSGLLYRIAQASGNVEDCVKFAPRPRFCLRESPHLRAGRESDEETRSRTSNQPRTQTETNSSQSANESEEKKIQEIIEDILRLKETTKEVSLTNSQKQCSTLKQQKSPKLISLTNDPCLIVIGGINPDNLDYPQNGSAIWRFSPEENSWDFVHDLPEPLINAGATYFDGIIYIIGGCAPIPRVYEKHLKPLTTVRTLRVNSGEWNCVEPLLNPRMNHAVCECRGHIYAVGGNGVEGKLLNSVERFDPNSGQWSFINPLGTARMAMSIGVLDGYVWVCGGFGNPKRGSKIPIVLDSVECLCFNTNSWYYCPPLRHARCFAAMTNFFGYLCIIGGAVLDSDFNLISSRDVDIWDKSAKKWKKITKLDVPRHGSIALTLGQHLHVIGGSSTTGYSALSSVECYSLRNRSWVEGVAILPIPLVGMTGLLLPPQKI